MQQTTYTNDTFRPDIALYEKSESISDDYNKLFNIEDIFFFILDLVLLFQKI